MNQASEGTKSGFEDGKFFVVYSKDAHALRDLEKTSGEAMRIVGNAFLWFVGLPFEKFPENSLQSYFFESIQRGCIYNSNKSRSGIKGGVKSGEVRKHQAACREIVFNGLDDIRGALTSGDCEIAIQAVMQYCEMRGDRKLENALRKRAKVIGYGRFAELCDKVITTENEPKKRSAAIIGILDKAANSQVDESGQEIGKV